MNVTELTAENYIEPGWSRSDCPNCHSSRRLGERLSSEELAVCSGIRKVTPIELQLTRMALTVEICDNCGTVYAVECRNGEGEVSH